MMNYKDIYKQIKIITNKLILRGLSDQQNFPYCKPIAKDSYEIAYSGMQDLSIVLKNHDYEDMYVKLEKSKNYNIKMMDGALIQFMYTYEKSQLIAHRLAFFPSPFLHEFQNQPEIYELDEIYADIIAKNILPVPVRFDYDPKNHRELDHPKSHLTLGQFTNCRIPVYSPITPNAFISFILRSFYNTAFKKFTDEFDLPSNVFDETITDKEKRILHIAILK